MKRTTLISFVIVFVMSFTIWNVAQQNYKTSHSKHRQERIAEKLNLTEDQQSAIEQLKIENQKEMIDLKADLQRKNLDLKELKTKGNYTREEYLKLVQSINSSKNNIAIAKANMRMDIYELLNAEQQKTFNEMGNHFGKYKNMRKHKEMERDQ
ncbi:MAG: Spy/CpxP family protein refolding chaperone [Ignavibacteriaceae bacterium]